MTGRLEIQVKKRWFGKWVEFGHTDDLQEAGKIFNEARKQYGEMRARIVFSVKEFYGTARPRCE
jgi:hypothetical protein